MLLKSLKLKNIRSYEEQTIEFTDSSTLLSGDIGSGKSTLLLAIEFALFGMSKPDLTGETLLRKGTTSASIELNFQIGNQDIIIQRNLKKTKNSITQSTGYIIVNNIKKELTPVELKTEIINILNYPEEFISKSKNYIFRYTIYCPQEEMKQILQETPDNRLDILRKIFNLDKYKKIRENLWYYLKQVRIQSTVLKTRIEPLEDKKLQLKDFRKQEKEINDSLKELFPKIEEIRNKIKDEKLQLLDLEEKNKKHLELKNQLTNLQNILKEKQNQQQNLVAKQKQLNEDISKLIIGNSKEEIDKELKELQEKQQVFIKDESELKTRIQTCQDKVVVLQKEISSLVESVSLIQENEEKTKSLEEELLEKENTTKERERLEKELDLLKQEVNKNKLLLSQSHEVADRIFQIDECPTCLQNISEEHKENVLQIQKEKKEKSEKELKKSTEELEVLQKRFFEINNKFDSFIEKEKQFTKFKIELVGLKEKECILKDKKEQLQEAVKENNQLIKKLEELGPEKLIELNKQISEKQEVLQKIVRKKELVKNLMAVSNDLNELVGEISCLIQQQKQNEQEIIKNPDFTERIISKKELLENDLEKEKNLFSEKTKFTTNFENLQKQMNDLVTEIDELNKFKLNLTKLTEIYHWLGEFLIKLTYTIEKQVMVRIHQLFSQLFQEWFSVLIEDENFSSRLDDSFTPVIEQDGYEILFSNLSGGERTAASLSYRLALNKVINDVIHEIRTKDLLILDEPTDGFSSEQLDKVRDVLERLQLRQTLIVSHESKIESFVDNVIRVGKNGGVSCVVR